MVHITELSVTILFASGILGLAMLLFAVNGYRRSRDRAIGFLAAAFLVFTIKSLFVAVAVWKDLVEHEALEAYDAIGDLGTIALMVVPVFWPHGEP